MAEAAKIIPLKSRALHFGKLQEVSHAWRELAAEIPAGTSFETILEPSYWKHYARDIQLKDVIKAVCDDGTWEASLRVMFVSPAEVKLKVQWQVDYEPVEVEVESDIYMVKWINVGKKYAVVRIDSGEVIQDGLFPKEKAYAYLSKHLSQLKT